MTGKLLCKLFGHRPEGPGWWGDVPYLRIKAGGVDNIGRVHGTCWHECRRCRETYLAGRIHLNDRTIMRAIERDPNLFAPLALQQENSRG